jgi:hypothetical protein
MSIISAAGAGVIARVAAANEDLMVSRHTRETLFAPSVDDVVAEGSF